MAATLNIIHRHFSKEQPKENPYSMFEYLSVVMELPLLGKVDVMNRAQGLRENQISTTFLIHTLTVSLSLHRHFSGDVCTFLAVYFSGGVIPLATSPLFW